MSRELESVFVGARAESRTAVIGYLPAGFPDPITFAHAVRSAVESGMDILEIGVPSDDATLDGKVITEALESLCGQDMGVDRAIELGGSVREETNVPAVAMAYWSTVRRYGLEAFAERCCKAGLDGVLIPDLPTDRAPAFCDRLRRLGLAPGYLVGNPAGTDAVRLVKECDPSFVYMKSSNGTTGERMDIPVAQGNLRQLRRSLRSGRPPIVVGFGIKGAAEAAALSQAGADGVVVGTSLVEAASEGTEAVRALIGRLSASTRLQEKSEP